MFLRPKAIYKDRFYKDKSIVNQQDAWWQGTLSWMKLTHNWHAVTCIAASWQLVSYFTEKWKQKVVCWTNNDAKVSETTNERRELSKLTNQKERKEKQYFCVTKVRECQVDFNYFLDVWQNEAT